MRSLKTLIMCLLLLPIGIQAEDKALLMGIGDYNGDGDYNDGKPNGSDLQGIDLDVKMMKEVVERLGFQNVRVLMDEEVTYRRMKRALQDLARGVGPNDRVLIYYSGHGFWVPDDNGDELDNRDEVLVAQDARVNDSGKIINVLRDDEFGELLAAIPSQNIYVLIDACHSGTTTKAWDWHSEEKPKAWHSDLAQVQTKIWTGPQNSDSKSTRSISISNSWIDTKSQGSFVDTKGVIAVPKSKYTLLSAAQDHEVALASSTGSYFTRGIHSAIMNTSNRKITMNNLKQKTTDYIATYIKREKPDYEVHRPNLIGEPKLWNQNMREPLTDTANVEPLWDILERCVDEISRESSQRLEIRTNKKEYKLGELLTIACRVNMDGYINVLNVDHRDAQKAIVLYPNKYHQNNRVRAGTTIRIPSQSDKFDLKTQPPLGENLIVIFVSSDSLSTYAMDVDDWQTKLFSEVLGDSLKKGFVPIASPQWLAGKVKIRIVQ